MKRLTYFLAIALTAVLAFACTQKIEDALTVSSSEITVSSYGAQQTLSFSSNVAWTVSSSADWITFDKSSGEAGAASVVMNTEIETIKMLSKEAKRQGKVHKVIIMIELGELREGVLEENVINFYEKAFDLENIQVVGIGANLSCLYGILPNQDKLVQLCLFKQLIEAKFNKKIRYVSGGTSVTIPMMSKNILPKGINHFRVGETLFLGTNVYDGTKLKNMHPDVFRLLAQIVELKEKPMPLRMRYSSSLTLKMVLLRKERSISSLE